jgi:aspartyl-tRNA(Asn)/glutamyl-tRNA(Gln) amidotransferase subunit A
VQRLKVAGAISLGKLNTYEFATGATSIIGASVNPWDTERSTGGSSGGSAAAVAAALCYAATGSDTGGSIRSPAAYCGIVGVKPTYGRVSRSGLIPFAWSLDHAGVLARSARDAALLLTVLAGPDELDPATDGSVPQNYLRESEDAARAVASMRIGVPDSDGLWGAHPEVVRIFDDSLKELERLVRGIVRIELPSADLMNAAYYGIRMPETTMIHQRWLRASADKYDPFTRRKALQGACLDACDYVEAQRFRRVLAAQVRALFVSTDLLAWPTTTRTSFLIEEPESAAGIGSELMNLTGYPSVSVPCGFTRDGLPVGMQITGRPREEGRILALAGAFARPSTIPNVTPTTKPQPVRSYPVARLPEGTNDREVRAARDEVRVALARNEFRVDEFDQELMAITHCAYRAVQRAARAQSEDVEPLVHQLPK